MPLKKLSIQLLTIEDSMVGRHLTSTIATFVFFYSSCVSLPYLLIWRWNAHYTLKQQHLMMEHRWNRLMLMPICLQIMNKYYCWLLCQPMVYPSSRNGVQGSGLIKPLLSYTLMPWHNYRLVGNAGQIGT